MNSEHPENTEETKEIKIPSAQGETLLAQYARTDEDGDEHANGCPCCLPR